MLILPEKDNTTVVQVLPDLWVITNSEESRNGKGEKIEAIAR